MLSRITELRERVAHGREVIESTLGLGKANFLWDAKSRDTVLALLLRWAEDSPEDHFIWWRGGWIQVGDFVKDIERVAAAWHAMGLRPGDTVALVLDNHPDYLVQAYALMYLGVRPALINPALRDASLEHAVTAAESVALVCDEGYLDICEPLRAHLRFGLFAKGDELFGQSQPVPPPHQSRLGDIAAYIYTSGTTGLPKAAKVKHRRIWRAGSVISGAVQFTSRDCVYCCLPLYHANAMCIAVPSAIVHRGRVALAERFSARAFWSDCIEAEATCFIYVGELLRYLLNRPAAPDERKHQVTRIFGNGLASSLWEQVESRFGITRIAEYYAATEGNAETLNLFNLRGTMGPILPWKMAVIAWDPEAEAPVRDGSGRASWVSPGEPGLLVGKISARNEFAGYGNQAASRAKVLRGLFKEDDAWFNTGDLVSYDRLAHLHFVDRLGDTFRWKAENVSTTEVAQRLGATPEIAEASVYGVSLPGHEGRAGMAAVVLRDPATFDGRVPAAFEELPRYAWPRFLRVVDSLEVTGTFKHRKQSLKREAWRECGEDALWILDLAQCRYRRFGQEEAAAIEAGSYPV